MQKSFTTACMRVNRSYRESCLSVFSGNAFTPQPDKERADVTFDANAVKPEQLCSEIEDWFDLALSSGFWRASP